LTEALTVPSTVPGAWVSVTWVPEGAWIRTLAVGSSSGLSDAFTVTVLPAWRTSSLAVV
jgi:hypothetical protein